MKTRHLSKRPLFAAGGSLLAVFVLSGCSDTEPVQASEKFVDVTTVPVEAVRNAATLTGEVQAADQADLSFRTSGRIDVIRVEVGERVARGDLLIELDNEQQRSDVSIAQANLAAAEAQLARARSDVVRQRSLSRDGVVSRATLDAAEETFRTTRNEVVAARSQLASARDVLAQTQLFAHRDGVVLERDAEIGQVVQVAQPLLTVAFGSEREAIFAVPESLLIQTQPQTVGVSRLNGPGAEIEGRIREISPAVDLETGTLQVTVELPAAGHGLFFGEPVSGTIEPERSEAIVLPWTALTKTEGRPAVWLLDEETNSVSMRHIAIGRYLTDMVEVVSGLEAGERVVVDGGKLIFSGQVVSPLGEGRP